jgi:choline dehydrogenase
LAVIVQDTTDEYDYVIVGGGAAGSVLARRLTEHPDVTVLALEAGASAIPANVDVAPLWYTLLGSTVDWAYRSVPQDGLGGRRTAEPRGKAPGGSSNLYLMMHIRGHPADFDDWAYQGAAGWSYRDVLPYFQRIEGQEDATGSIGSAGPQTITNAGWHDPNPVSGTFLAACAELGYPAVDDFNGPDMVGAGWHHLDVKDGRRQGVLASYLEPALGRPNLTLRTSARATRLLVGSGRCDGVEYLQEPEPPAPDGTARHAGGPGPQNGLRRVRARREVLLCAGAIESPKLLMLSGVGPPEQLRGHGIEVTAALPGVGRNFHNHVLTGLMTELTESVAVGRQNLSEVALFTRSDPGLVAPDLQIAFVHVPFDFTVAAQHPDTVSILPGVVRPAARGWVRLADADPRTPPLINPNYLGDRWDVERMIQGVRLSREIFGTSAFSAIAKQELSPGSEISTDAEIERFVRRTADSYHHQVGSCRMGSDDMSVVDPQLRVHGVDGLRVVDASVMPSVPSGNCHAAVAMIAERAADLLASAHPEGVPR